MVMPLISQNWDFQPFKMLLKDNLQMFSLIFPMDKSYPEMWIVSKTTISYTFKANI